MSNPRFCAVSCPEDDPEGCHASVSDPIHRSCARNRRAVGTRVCYVRTRLDLAWIAAAVANHFIGGTRSPSAITSSA